MSVNQRLHCLWPAHPVGPSLIGFSRVQVSGTLCGANCVFFLEVFHRHVSQIRTWKHSHGHSAEWCVQVQRPMQLLYRGDQLRHFDVELNLVSWAQMRREYNNEQIAVVFWFCCFAVPNLILFPFFIPIPLLFEFYATSVCLNGFFFKKKQQYIPHDLTACLIKSDFPLYIT